MFHIDLVNQVVKNKFLWQVMSTKMVSLCMYVSSRTQVKFKMLKFLNLEDDIFHKKLGSIKGFH